MITLPRSARKMITLPLLLCALSTMTPGVRGFWCYECSSVTQYCNDEKGGVDTPRMGSCDGGQCTKIVVVTEDHDESKSVDTLRTHTERGCIPYGSNFHEDGCGTVTTNDEENMLTVTTTACYCSTPYCNAAWSTMIPSVGMMVMLVFFGQWLL